MAGENEKQEYALAGLVEECDRLVAAYNATSAEARNFPEVKATLKENLAMIVDQIKAIDEAKVPEAAKNIIEEGEAKSE